MKYLYFLIGGILIFSSAVAFLYFVMFGKAVTFEQWLADFILGTVGAIFLSMPESKGKK